MIILASEPVELFEKSSYLWWAQGVATGVSRSGSAKAMTWLLSCASKYAIRFFNKMVLVLR